MTTEKKNHLFGLEKKTRYQTMSDHLKQPVYLEKLRSIAKLKVKGIPLDRPVGIDPRVIKKDTSDGKYRGTDCKRILRDPLQSFCGHRYCKACFTHLIQNNAGPVKCKACVQEGSETEFSVLKEQHTFPDNGIKREMGSFPAQCINIGCSWHGKFKDYEPHESTCPHKRELCPQCGGAYPPGELPQHQASQCPAKPANCPHCHEASNAAMLKYHVERCGKAPVECTGCKKSLLREELLQHSDPQSKECPRPLIPCPLGCPDLVQVSDVHDHLGRTSVDLHLAEINHRLEELADEVKVVLRRRQSAPEGAAAAAVAVPETSSRETQVLASQVESIQSKIQELEAKISTTSTQVVANASPSLAPFSGPPLQGTPRAATSGRDVEMLDRKIHVFERVSAVFKRELERIGQQQEDLLKQAQENREKNDILMRQYSTLERAISIQKTQIADVTQRLAASDATAFDGVLIWKLSQFNHRRQEAVAGRVTSFYSPSFYTSRTGYKACARVYLNGDGMGKGTHVSLFFVLMRGEYDALLQWPFQQKVTLMWIDQNRKENVIDTFRPDPTSSSFKRPTSDMNIASGCPLFMPISTLDSPSQGFMKDDVAFLKIIIDKTGLGDPL